jgi:predicted TIM-barrel fold metal-dependent hydrolase
MKLRSKTTLVVLCTLLSLEAAGAQEMSFEEYDPPSTLVVPEHNVTRAKFPFIDVHNHQWQMPGQELSALIAEMDKLNMAVMVNLSGRSFRRLRNPDGTFSFKMLSPQHLEESLENVRKNAPNRFIIFTNVDFDSIGRPGWTEEAVKQLEHDIQSGAAGLKIYKSLGMNIVDSNGERVPVDDKRLDPIWQKCSELGVPVLIHTADPAPFWSPQDARNERWLELKERPERKRDPETEPSWEQLLREQHTVFRRHPKTTFINAHLGWMGNDLGKLGELFDECPNVYSEIGAVLAELGRQPRFAHAWFIKYQDRVLFGKDSWAPDEYHVYFRVLETDDEYFDYYRRRHAFWKMYGMDLPDDVLRKLYYKNAIKIIPGIDASLFPE